MDRVDPTRTSKPTRPLRELLVLIGSSDEVPQIEGTYGRRAGQIIADAAAKNWPVRRPRRRDRMIAH